MWLNIFLNIENFVKSIPISGDLIIYLPFLFFLFCYTGLKHTKNILVVTAMWNYAYCVFFFNLLINIAYKVYFFYFVDENYYELHQFANCRAFLHSTLKLFWEISPVTQNILFFFYLLTFFIFVICRRIYSRPDHYIKKQHEKIIFEWPFIYFLFLIGIMSTVHAIDLIIAVVSLELVSICVYFFIVLNRKSLKALEAMLKYFAYNSLGTVIFLLGSFFIAFEKKSTHFIAANFKYDPVVLNQPKIFNSEIAHRYTYDVGFLEIENIIFLKFGFFLVLIALLLKLGCAPFQFWVADVADGSNWPSFLIFSLPVKLNIIFLIFKLYHTLFFLFSDILRDALLIFSLLSVIAGAVGALTQKKIKRLLAFSSVNHVGYLLLFISLTPVSAAYRGLLLYAIVYTFTTLTLFIYFISLTTYSYSRGGVISIKVIQPVYLTDIAPASSKLPFFSFCAVCSLFSLTGLPPFFGFLPKLIIFTLLITKKYYFSLLLILICSLISALYYFKIVKSIFFSSSSNLKVNYLNSYYLHINLFSFIFVLFATIFLIVGFVFFFPFVIQLFINDLSSFVFSDRTYYYYYLIKFIEYSIVFD
jgi:NADH-quinone oxidoreductase subunit N